MKPSRVALGLLALALVLVAGRADAATPVPLGLIVVPRSALGPEAAGLQIELLSGLTSNTRAADDSYDPSDTVVSVSQAGRVSGFTLIYGDPGFEALRRGKGLIDLGTSVDLFKTVRQAKAYKAKSLRDLKRALGQNLQGVVVESVRSFPVRGLGPDAIGVRAVQRIGTKRIFNTYVDFLAGSFLCEAAVRRADATKVDAQAVAIARSLAGRVAKQSRGELHGDPVTLPRPLGMSRPGPKAPKLESMVLTAGDLDGAGTVIAQGYLPDDNAIGSYYRQFQFNPASGLSLLRSSVALERSPREAGGRMVILRLPFTGPEAASTLAGLVTPSATAVTLDGVRSGLGVGDESFAVSASFTAGSQRTRIVLVHVRRERVVGTLIVVGTPKRLTTGRIDTYARTFGKKMQAAVGKPTLIA